MPRDAAASAPRGAVMSDLIELLRLSGPVVLSRLGIMVMGLTDAIVVGRFSAEQLGFHAMAWAPSSVFVTMTVGLLVGAQVMTSRAIGAGKPHDTGAVLRRGLVYAFWIGMASAVSLALLGPPLLHAVHLPKALADGATAPMIVFSLSLPLYALTVVISFWLEGLSRPGPVTIAMWVANAVNLAVNLLLVPGTFGLPALGAVGGAWATFVARLALLVMLGVYVMRLKDARTLGVFDKPARDLPASIEQRRIGYGAGASNFFEVAAFAGMSLVAAWISGLRQAGCIPVIKHIPGHGRARVLGAIADLADAIVRRSEEQRRRNALSKDFTHAVTLKCPREDMRSGHIVCDGLRRASFRHDIHALTLLGASAPSCITSTIFPIWALASIFLWASATRSNGKTESIKGLARPASTSGKTFFSSAAATCAFIGIGRTRMVDPTSVSRLVIRSVKSMSTRAPCWNAICEIRPSTATASRLRWI